MGTAWTLHKLTMELSDKEIGVSFGTRAMWTGMWKVKTYQEIVYWNFTT